MKIRFATRFRSTRVISIYCIAAMMFGGCQITGKDGVESSHKETIKDAAILAHQSLDYEAAAKHYSDLYKRDPGDTEALLGAARNLRYSGSIDEAIELIETGISDHGQIPAFVLELSKLQITGQRFEEAGKTLDLAAQLLPDDWDVLSTMGIFHDYLGDFVVAQAAYTAALELSPNNVVVINNLALSLAQSGSLERGIEILAKLVKDKKSSPQSRQNLAMLYALAGDIKRAEELARQDLPEDVVLENLSTFQQMH